MKLVPRKADEADLDSSDWEWNHSFEKFNSIVTATKETNGNLVVTVNPVQLVDCNTAQKATWTFSSEYLLSIANLLISRLSTGSNSLVKVKSSASFPYRTSTRTCFSYPRSTSADEWF